MKQSDELATTLTKREYFALEMVKTVVISHAILNAKNLDRMPGTELNLETAFKLAKSFMDELNKESNL